MSYQLKGGEPTLDSRALFLFTAGAFKERHFEREPSEFSKARTKLALGPRVGKTKIIEMKNQLYLL